MNNLDYIESALRTESRHQAYIEKNLAAASRLMHGAVGLATESGEILDALKKFAFYNKPLDRVNIIEELGDIMWYCAILADELGVTFEEIMDKNIRKLKKRYPEKFDTELAVERNLEEERRALME